MEIGSEFWEFSESLNCDNSKFWNIGKDTKFTLSGRTSIYYVLENILKNKQIKKAYLPSYSCSSMAEPFFDLGIEVEYYFGYSNTNMDLYIKKFKEQGKIVIEDITHSIFSSKRYSENSDYLIGSLRKWMPIASGGIAVNMNSNFEVELNLKSNAKMIDIKKSAMQNKKDYIENTNNISKEMFLNQYAQSGKVLDEDYKNYSIDEESLKIIMGININKIVNSRIENAKIIYEKLRNNVNVRFLIEDYNQNDSLLFVPIILEHDLRDKLRKYLIEKQVYLPIHWPLEERINNVFEKELSLICDQRYTKKEISEYIETIIEFLTIS